MSSENQNYSVGIDLGTSTSEISIIREFGDLCETLPDTNSHSPVVPSVVAWDEESQEVIVGDSAQRVPNSIREIKRIMETPEKKVKLGSKEFYPQQISALILRRLKNNLCVALGLSPEELAKPIDICLTCPAIFSEKARAATLAAGQDAGFNVLRLINEPTAAALYYAIESRVDLDGMVMVFDFGGGTLDMTVGECTKSDEGINFDVICNFGDQSIGGKDIDKVMMDYVREKFLEDSPNARINTKSENLLKEAVIDAKKELSTQKRASIYLPGFAIENRLPIDLDCVITREEFETILNEYPVSENDDTNDTSEVSKRGNMSVAERVKTCLTRMFDLNKNISREEIQRLLFVGGSSYIPLIQNIVLEELHLSQDKIMIMSPDLAVSKGAAYFAAGKGTGAQVSPYGLGIEGHGETYLPLVPPQSTIPALFKSSGWSLMHRYQTTCRYSLYQDLTGQAVSTRKLPNNRNFCEDPDVFDTGLSVEIKNIPPSDTSEPRETEAVATYDENGMVEFEFSIPSTGQKARMSYQVKPLSGIATSVTGIAIKGID